MKYLIRPQDRESMLALDKASTVQVLVPHGWACSQANGTGDFTFQCEETVVEFSLTEPGWVVETHGPMSGESAEQLVEIVSGQLARATDIETEWLPIEGDPV